MAETIIIQLSEITKGTPLSGNIDADKFVYLIKDIQLQVLEPALGTKLYDKMKTDYAVPLTYVGDYLILYNDYILPILKFLTAAEYIDIASYIVSNEGVFKRAPENSESASRGDVNDLADKQRAKADVYLARMERFLEYKTATIPEWKANQDNEFDIDVDRDVRTYGGLYFSGNNDKYKKSNNSENLPWDTN